MQVSCPLPIDWLEYLRGDHSEDRAEHLSDCPSCRAVVAQLEMAVAKRDLLGRTGELSEFGRATWGGMPFTSVEAGQIWFTGESFREGAFDYEQQDRVPVLVLGETSRASRRWFEVVPVWTDTENATQTDLLLRQEHTSIGCELRLLFRLQGWLAEGQLDSGVGKLTDRGKVLVDAALAGMAGDEHFGIPVEGADDARLDEPRWMARAIRMGQSFYLVHREMAEPVQSSAAPSLTESKIIPLQIKWVPKKSREATVAWAASTHSGHTDMQADVTVAWGRFVANVQHDILQDDQLLVWLLDVQGFERPVRLLVRWTNGEPILSDPFVPRIGEKVVLGQGQDVFLKDIEGIDLLTE